MIGSLHDWPELDRTRNAARRPAPILGLGVIAAFIPFYWRPIPGETTSPAEVTRR